HTSFSRDWSSDVCSSDLGTPDHRQIPRVAEHCILQRAQKAGLTRPESRNAREVGGTMGVSRIDSRFTKPNRRSVMQLKITGLQLDVTRSEEHTSELQSRENLVCRLLLEKKK